MAFLIALIVLALAAVLSRRFGDEDREYRSLGFPPEWPRLPELPPASYGATTPVAAVPVPRPSAERTPDLVS